MRALPYNPRAFLPRRFFDGPAPEVARDLLGQVLVHRHAAGVIVETEAYDESDPASHSYRGRTPRNAAMFGRGGCAYVYRSYGIHWCMNVSVGPQGYGAAVLLRALQPIAGLDAMARRRGSAQPTVRLARGPGCLTQALGITGAHDGADLLGGALCLVAGPDWAQALAQVATPRIGISRATEVAWRFAVADCPYVSGPKTPRRPRPSP